MQTAKDSGIKKPRPEGRGNTLADRGHTTMNRMEGNEDGTIPIFFTLDDSYALCLGPALQSMVDNADQSRTYVVVVIYEDLSDEHREKFQAIIDESDAFSIRFVPMAGKIQGIQNREGNYLRADYFTLTIFFRLFIPEMFPEWDKGIYIDSDIIVPGDISELFDTELGDNLIGACHDASILGIPEIVEYTNVAVGVGIENYINSGMLVFNMKALREVGLQGRFLELMDKYNFDCVAPDQDYFNSLCFGKITYIDQEWDAMPAEGQPEMENPKLIHYNLFSKPWCYDGIAYGDYFWKYAKESGFYEEAKAYKEGYSDEQKSHDAEALAQLCERGVEIGKRGGNTMAAVFNSGKEPRL